MHMEFDAGTWTQTNKASSDPRIYVRAARAF